jgi:hypothetical protein
MICESSIADLKKNEAVADENNFIKAKIELDRDVLKRN